MADRAAAVNTVDVAIVGGGPAGAATAARLAATGCEVMLLERTAGPHHKVCGEFLSGETVAHLRCLGIDPSDLGAVAIDHAAVFAAGRRGAFRLPFRALSLSRYRLDQALLARAKGAGAELRRGVAVRSAEPLEMGWQLRCSDGSEIRCRRLALATGKRPLRGMADGRDRSMVGLKMHLRLQPARTRALAGRVELFLFDKGYAGLETVEGGTANLCLIMPATVAARIGRGWTPLRDHLVSAAPCLAEQLDGAAAHWEEPLAIVCPGGGFAHRASAPSLGGAYRVGDRLAHIPPFAGDGLAIALASADLAARHIRQGSAPAVYLTEARSLVAPAVRLAAAVARLSGCGFGRALAAHLAVHAPLLLRSLALRTRVAWPLEMQMEPRE
jgi:flavin-dependent dehydrogenase